MNNKIKIGITMGDPSGIGPRIAAMAIDRLKNLAEFVVIGDRWVFNQTGYTVGRAHYKFIDLHNVNRAKFAFGNVRREYGKASVEYLDMSQELLENKEIDCVVTCPISKESINLAGFKYSGHTEYFSKRANTKNIAMMLLNRGLKISLITRHIPLRRVPLLLKKDAIFKTVLLTHAALKKLFFIRNPRIVVCGLNPHASDNGLIGKEENMVIKPALKKIKTKIGFIDGPLSADVAISKTKQKLYDCAVAMYHDQALIPLKLAGGSYGVNITLGLPFVRTSPLHGTAFELSGSNLNSANPDSLVEAIRLAEKCTRNQLNEYTL